MADCVPSPYSPQTSPYGRGSSPYAAATSPYARALSPFTAILNAYNRICIRPVLLYPETGRPILWDDGVTIAL